MRENNLFKIFSMIQRKYLLKLKNICLIQTKYLYTSLYRLVALPNGWKWFQII